ncbi:MAG: ABC transporter ATP-binding protein [Anaerolineae bacterium]|nr:ABC transporter ATP-binding protein [Anaerolineae bacterium]
MQSNTVTENIKPKAMLVVEHLQIWYGSTHAVDDLSCEIEAGEIYGLLGPNGAGKTSTLSAIEGLVSPQSGHIRIAGYDTKTHPLEAKASVGIQLQATSFQPELTISEIIRLYAGLYGLKLSPSDIQNMLHDIHLDAEASRRYGQLSGGQQQRVSLIIATLHNPQLVLLDEPTSGLDPQSRRQLWDRIDRIRSTGRSILLTTHSMEEAAAICDRITIMDNGKIITTQTPANLVEEFKDDPRVIKAARGAVTLEDVFIGLTGSEVRD